MKNNAKFIRGILFSSLPLLSLTLIAQESRKRPNVVLILADDLGYGDLSYTGAPDIKTPNIDAIASEGVEYTNYYTSAPTSTPTRCALISGRYQARFKNMEEAFHMGVTHIGFPENEETLPRALQREGYKTALVGKWHLGTLPKLMPTNHGFDLFEGFLSGNIDYFAHCERNRTPDLYHQEKAITSKEYITDFIANRSIDFIKKNRKDPFFLYVAFNAPHWPYQGPGDGPCAIDGSDWMKGSRGKLVSMIEYQDKCVGRILQTIRSLKLEENTLVIFSSDNGGDKFARNTPFKGGKGSLEEGGLRVPLAMRWKGSILPRQKCDYQLITMDITATILDMCNVSFNAIKDGVSFYPFSSKEYFQNRPLVWRNGMRNQYAVRLGEFKLFVGKNGVSLYNVVEDPGEKKDISRENPQKVAHLQEVYDCWEKEMPYKQTRFGSLLRKDNLSMTVDEEFLGE